MKIKNSYLTLIVPFIASLFLVGAIVTAMVMQSQQEDTKQYIQKVAKQSQNIYKIGLRASIYAHFDRQEDSSQLMYLLEDLSYTFVELAQNAEGSILQESFFEEGGLHKNIVLFNGLIHQYILTKELNYLDVAIKTIPKVVAGYERIAQLKTQDFQSSLLKLRLLFMGCLIAFGVIVLVWCIFLRGKNLNP